VSGPGNFAGGEEETAKGKNIPERRFIGTGGKGGGGGNMKTSNGKWDKGYKGYPCWGEKRTEQEGTTTIGFAMPGLRSGQ